MYRVMVAVAQPGASRVAQPGSVVEIPIVVRDGEFHRRPMAPFAIIIPANLVMVIAVSVAIRAVAVIQAALAPTRPQHSGQNCKPIWRWGEYLLLSH
ncbi:Uncharacterised protein [Yersinia kristensenii]|nr:Uncharacterised protein [Yersinia kristensenii]CNF35775.1 Uncharacterised protein [Yersinia kristensenii]